MNFVLLLEDHADARARLNELAAAAYPGATFVEAESVAEALVAVAATRFAAAVVDLGLPDGSGVEVLRALRRAQPEVRAVVATIHGDDEHVFAALQAGAFGYVLKDQLGTGHANPLLRMAQGEPPLSPAIARRMLAHFASAARRDSGPSGLPRVSLSDRENEVLVGVARGFTLQEIALQLSLSRYTISDYVKQVYRKLNISSRAEAALEARRLGLFGRGRHSDLRSDPGRQIEPS